MRGKKDRFRCPIPSTCYDELFDLPLAASHKVYSQKPPKKTYGKHSIGHYMKILDVQPEMSLSRRTYGENIDLKLRIKKSQIRNPGGLLEWIFQHLLYRLYKGSNFKGTPKSVALQIDNKYFSSPFYVPHRPISQNNPKALAAALMWLSSQSGGRLRLFKTRTRVKLYAIWPLSRNKTKSTKIIGGGKRLKKGQKRYKLYAGSCSKESQWLSAEDKKHRGIIPIENMDNLCLARAISVGIIHGLYGLKMAKKIAGNESCQRKIAKAILKNAGIRPNLKKYNLKHISKIQMWLGKKFRIGVFHAESGFRLIYRGRFCANFNIFILLNGQHFEYIACTKKLFQARGEFCLDCKTPCYTQSHNQNCRRCCRLCYRYGNGFPCVQEKGHPIIMCQDCRFYFPNNSCFLHHKKRGPRGGNSICQNRFYCQNCSKVVYKRAGPHKCLKIRFNIEKCKDCGSDKSALFPHFCFIQPEEPKLYQNVRYIFYDIEATQTDKVRINGAKCWKHRPNLLCCEIICQKCIENPQINLPAGNVPSMARDPECFCGVFGSKFRWKWANLIENNPRVLFFRQFDMPGWPQNPKKHQSVANQFLDFFMYSGDRETLNIVLAHNAGKYDLHLLIDSVFARNIQPKLIMTGLKIFSMKMSGSNQRTIWMKDSLNFLMGSLSSFFSTFNLMNCPGIEEKPSFPHKYNKEANLTKMLSHLPPISKYSINNMKKEEREKTLLWYRQNKNNAFILALALVDYCRNDTQTLRETCIRFREMILAIAPGIDPFIHASTLAKLALNIWKAHFLKPNMFITLPENGFRPNELQSQEALKFFRLYSKITGQNVQTAESTEGEHISYANDNSFQFGSSNQAGDYLIDGYVLPEDPNEQPIALEYLGCAFHGCEKCFPNRNECLQGGKTPEDLFVRTRARKAELQRRGYNVIEIWACDFKRLLDENWDLRKKWNKIQAPQPPLNPRTDALRGGRVEPFKLYEQAGDDELIEHYDVVSLYPSVMKSCKYPIGLPIVYTREDLARFEIPPFPWKGRNLQFPFLGLLLVRILPPRRIPSPSKQIPLPPFVPYRTKLGQLVFPLCSACADAQNGRKCRHDENQRSWVAAFPHEDIQLALELDYSILEIFEVWHWAPEQWSDELFKGYINALLKLKIESSGWPEQCKSEEEKWQFVQAYLEREGIKLGDIKHNKILRMIAKLLLNSLWGKLCQRPNNAKVIITKTPRAFHDIIDDPRFDILDTTHLNKFMDRIVYRMKPAFIQPPKTNNVPIASIITANGRRLLYRIFQEAVSKENNIIYCDTDSIVIKRKVWQQQIRQGEILGICKGNCLGEGLNDGLPGGPKNYAYVHTKEDGTDPILVRRIRGFEMTHKANRKITFESMLAEVKKRFGPNKNSNTKGISVPYVAFQRHKKGMLYTRTVRKNYRAVFEKGLVIPEDLTTRPFGWVNEK